MSGVRGMNEDRIRRHKLSSPTTGREKAGCERKIGSAGRRLGGRRLLEDLLSNGAAYRICKSKGAHRRADFLWQKNSRRGSVPG